MTCQQELRRQGKPYPRTCQDCGLGPCKHPVQPHPAIQHSNPPFHTMKPEAQEAVNATAEAAVKHLSFPTYRQIGWYVTRIGSGYREFSELSQKLTQGDRNAGFREQPVFVCEDDQPK